VHKPLRASLVTARRSLQGTACGATLAHPARHVQILPRRVRRGWTTRTSG